jgi:D-alanyl-D-alanine carboxypeptidase
MVDQEAGIPVTKDNLFRIASITKTFVAATILKLVEGDILTLEDSVEHWLPGLVPNGDNITIRHLLNHTSGLYNYKGEAFSESLKDPNRVWQPEELVAIATSKPPMFAPGERHLYCNTGYILLGMIIETATDSTVEQEMRRLLLDPLQLNNTFLDGREEVPEELIIRADTDPDPYTAMATCMWTMGGMVSNAEDLLKWAEALYGGKVLEPKSLDEMLTFTEVSPIYGLGVMLRNSRFGASFGHIGSIPGHNSQMYYIPEAGITMVGMGVPGGDPSGAALYEIFKIFAVQPAGSLVSTWGRMKNSR